MDLNRNASNLNDKIELAWIRLNFLLKLIEYG